MANTKQVKVDNWGVFFLQRLKHFFNRTDYCDLTLQFHGYAQLKVHRLVLNACTEYFELLEKTCEMLDDCLMMPDDLQVDVILPIINFMYTGQLEYECHLFEKLYATAQIMNMTVLTKLLDAQRNEINPPKPPAPKKNNIVLMNAQLTDGGTFKAIPSTSAEPEFPAQVLGKRLMSGRQYRPASSIVRTDIMPRLLPVVKQAPKKMRYEKPKPTRYEVPEELENENLFEASFADISYESQPLMRSYTREKTESTVKVKSVYDEASCSRKFEELQASSSAQKRPRIDSLEDNKNNILEQIDDYNYQQKVKNNYSQQNQSEEDIFETSNDVSQDSEMLFNQVNESGLQNVTVKQSGKSTASTLDHAKIISEVLKKYPHLVKSNKNIKLKILPGNSSSSSRQIAQSIVIEPKKVRAISSPPKFDITESERDWSFVNKSLNQESVARLVSLGAANVNGPWLCLICGTPGKALNFATYNKYYRHLADIHLEKISANICEHCGYRSGKRNHLLHHMYTKHGVPPPPHFNFPKCEQCNYIALTKAFLIKHKLSHVDNREFLCNVCNSSFKTRASLLNHIQSTGHKISPARKVTNQCVYCNKIFLREANLYTHLKLSHKELARKDGIIDNSDDEDNDNTKYESTAYEYTESPKHVSIKQEHDGKIHIISNIPVRKQTLLNTKLLNNEVYNKVKIDPNTKFISSSVTQQSAMETTTENESFSSVATDIETNMSLADRIVMFNDSEYVIHSEQEDNQTMMEQEEEVILPDLHEEYYDHSIQVSMPQQTSTTQIMSQKQIKAPFKLPQPGVKNITGHQIIVSSPQQPYKTIISSTPYVLTTNVQTSTPVAPKYVQAQPSASIASSSGDTIMVLQDEDINIDQSMTSDGSNIVVVYSHPIASSDKQFVGVNQEQYGNQYVESQQVVADEQTHELNTDEAMIVPDHQIIHETVESEEWNESNIQETPSMEKEGENIEQQEIPIVENEGTEVVVEENICGEEIMQGDISDEAQHVSNEERVYSEEMVEYGEVGHGEDVTTEEETITPDDNHQPVEEETIQQISGVGDTNNQVVEWSDDELTSKEIQQGEMCVVNTQQEEHTEEIEMEEESIENIEKEVQKHITDKTDLANTDINVIATDNMGDDAIQSAEEPVSLSEIPIVERAEGSIETDEEIVETNQSTLEEEQVIEENEVNTELEEQSTAEESEADHSIVAEDKSEDIESEDNSDTNVADKQKSAEKISNLLNDWDDNDSQNEIVSEEQDAEDGEHVATTDEDPKNKEEVEGRNGNDCEPAKVANIEKIVSDWDDDEEK